MTRRVATRAHHPRRRREDRVPPRVFLADRATEGSCNFCVDGSYTRVLVVESGNQHGASLRVRFCQPCAAAVRGGF